MISSGETVTSLQSLVQSDDTDTSLQSLSPRGSYLVWEYLPNKFKMTDPWTVRMNTYWPEVCLSYCLFLLRFTEMADK